MTQSRDSSKHTEHEKGTSHSTTTLVGQKNDMHAQIVVCVRGDAPFLRSAFRRGMTADHGRQRPVISPVPLVPPPRMPVRIKTPVNE
jgi:hypothetical protein